MHDPTLLLVYYGDASLYAYAARSVCEQVGQRTDEIDLSPTELADKLNIEGAILIEVDAGWNGVNYYAFAPKD